MTKKIPVSMQAILALLLLIPAAEVAAQEAEGGGFMSAIAEFFDAGGPFIYINCIPLCWGIAIIIERIIFIFFKYNVNAEAFMAQVQKLVSAYEPSRLPDAVKDQLTRLMEGEARRHGMDSLPRRET